MSGNRRRGQVGEVVETNLEKTDHRKNDDNDISFMDTQQMDVSTWNTQPMELNDSNGEEDEVSEHESETSVSDVGNEKEPEPEQLDDSNNEDNNANESDQFDAASDNENIMNESDPDAESGDDCNFRNDISHLYDESSSGSSQTPAVELKSQEVKQIYSDLIDSCRGFDDNLSFREGSNKRVLKDNIKTGQELFHKLEMTLSNTFSEAEGDTTGRPTLGYSTSEFLLACEHTKYCANMLSHAVNNATNYENVFNVDEFLYNLRNSCLDNLGGYSVLSSVKKLAFTASSVAYSVSHFKSIMGCVDTDSFRSQAESVPETPKIRLKRKKDEIKGKNATQMKIGNEKSKSKFSDLGNEIQNDTPEGLASNILKSVKNNCKDLRGPVNMLQVTHAENLPDVLSRMFGVAFLVREGFLSLNVPGDVDAATSCTALTLKPDKPPKNEKGEERKQRNQHIASFSSRLLKRVVANRQEADNK